VDVAALYKHWSERDVKYFGKVSDKLTGIRCLRQDPWECTLSFICSQNNNIKRITGLVRSIRNNFGSKICVGPDQTDIYAFPSFDAFKEKVTEQKLRELGFGYRAPYIVKSTKYIETKGGASWLDSLRGKPPSVVREELTQLHGVGSKVADCIALFSIDCPSVIPVDTHVFQIA